MQITNSLPPYKPLYEEEDPATPDPEHQQTAQFPEDYKQKKQPSIGKVVGSNLDSPMSQERNSPYYEEARTPRRKKEVKDPVQTKENYRLNELDKVIAYLLIFSNDGTPPCEFIKENFLVIRVEDYDTGKSDDLISDFIGDRKLKLYDKQPVSESSILRNFAIFKSVKKALSEGALALDFLDGMFN